MAQGAVAVPAALAKGPTAVPGPSAAGATAVSAARAGGPIAVAPCRAVFSIAIAVFAMVAVTTGRAGPVAVVALALGAAAASAGGARWFVAVVRDVPGEPGYIRTSGAGEEAKSAHGFRNGGDIAPGIRKSGGEVAAGPEIRNSGDET